MESSFEFTLIIKEEVKEEDVQEDDADCSKNILESEEEKKRRQREEKAAYCRERRAREKRIVNGEEDSVSEHERQKVIEKFERQKREHAARYQKRKDREQRILNGEDDSASEQERQKVIEKFERKRLQKEKQRQKDEERQKISNTERMRLYREKVRKIVTGDDPTVSEQERKQIAEKFEKEKERDRQYQRERLRRQKEEIQLTAEEVKEIRVKKYFQKQAWLAKLTREEREAMKQRRSEWHKNHRQSMSKEEKEREQQRFREWVKGLTGEKKRRYQESMRRRMKKQMEKMKAERKMEGSQGAWRHNQKMLEYQRKVVASETPEQRRKRLIRYKVYSARIKMKKQLEEEGLQKEEIERRLKVFTEEMKAELESKEGGIPVSEYKPRPRKPKKQGRSQTLSMEESPVSPEERCQEESSTSVILDPETGAFTVAPASPGYSECFHDNPASPPPIGMYPCSFCSTPPFVTDSDLREHLRSSHFSVCWKCPKCKEVLVSPQELSEHYKSNHSQSHSTSDTRPLLNSHPHSGNTSNRNFLCMRCPWNLHSSEISFKSSADLLDHVRQTHPSSFWPCSKCHLLKYSMQTLEIHEKLCAFKTNSLKSIS